jgi:ribosomal RNA-processing protein 12
MVLAQHDSLTHVLQTVAAGLGAETTHMRSAAVMGLSRLIFEYAWNDSTFHSLLPSILITVLVLINEDSREVIKSVIGFVRVSVTAIPPAQLSPLLPELVGSLLTYHKKKDRFRAKIKIIIKKLVNVFGYEMLMPLVPESETRLLTHMRKLDERRKRKKSAEREARQKTGKFDDLIDSDEEDSDDGRTFMSGMTGFSRRSGRLSRANTTSSTKKSTSRLAKKIRLPNGSDGNVVDMLGSKVSKLVHFDDDIADDSDSDSMAMEFDDNGKLVVRNDDETNIQEPVVNSSSSLLDRTKKRRKTGQGEQSKKGSTKGGAMGAAYKSTRAGGDVMKKGQQYEPYALIPLDGRAYTKKNRRTTVDQMSTVVRGSSKRKRTTHSHIK